MRNSVPFHCCIVTIFSQRAILEETADLANSTEAAQNAFTFLHRRCSLHTYRKLFSSIDGSGVETVAGSVLINGLCGTVVTVDNSSETVAIYDVWKNHEPANRYPKMFGSKARYFTVLSIAVVINTCYSQQGMTHHDSMLPTAGVLWWVGPRWHVCNSSRRPTVDISHASAFSDEIDWIGKGPTHATPSGRT